MVANIGVHGAPATLLQLVRDRRLGPERLATDSFDLGDILDAYDVFADAGTHDALKVVLRR